MTTNMSMEPLKIREEVNLTEGVEQFFKKTTKYNVIIEGNIGAGKSTILKFFEKIGPPKVQTIGEPLDKWSNFHGANLLELMYSDVTSWIFPFQVYSILTMIKNHAKQVDENVKIMERSIYSAMYCFIEMHRQLKNLDSIKYKILKKWFYHCLKTTKIDVDLIIYLRTTPDVLVERIKRRNRPEEQNMDVKHLKVLHKLHDKWLIKKKIPVPAQVIVLDGNRSPDEVLMELNEKLYSWGMAHDFIPEPEAASGEISIFRGENFFLSNLYSTNIKWGDRVFKSAEHFYQAAKCLEKSAAEKIYLAETSKSAKILGKFVKRRYHWHVDRVGVMETILRMKFRNKKLKRMLIETGDKQLIDQNFYHERFWGQCGCTKHQKKGRNIMGKILMKIRADIDMKKPATKICCLQ